MSALLLLGLSMAASGKAAAAAIELTADGAAVMEGGSGTTTPLPFNIRRGGSAENRAASQLVFQAQTQGGSAIAQSDYVSLPNMSFRIPVGTDSMSLEIRINGDSAAESDERFVLRLSEPLLTGPDPEFSGPTSFPVGAQFLIQHQPVAIAQGDVNGDGRPDLALANNSPYSRDAAVLLNTTPTGATTPNFSAPSNYPTGSSPGGVALGDLNGDDKPDLVVANGTYVAVETGSVSVLINSTATGASSPSFSAATNYLNDFSDPCGPADATLGDLNGDNQLDLIVTCNISTSLAVLLNNTAVGASTLSFSATYSTSLDGHNLGRIFLADINTDGRPDVVINAVADPYDGYVIALINTTPNGASSPSFGPLASFPVGDIPGRVAIADLNADGSPDLAVPIGENSNADPGNPYHKASRVTILFNLTEPGAETARFGPLYEYFAVGGRETAVLIDVNGDSRPDLFTNGPTGPLEMYLNTTPDRATAPRLMAAGAVATPGWIADMVTTDFNSDGRNDIALANYDPSYDEASILLNTTTQLPSGTDTSVVIARGEANGTILNDDGGSGSSSSSSSGSSGGGSTSSGSSGATGSSGSSSGAQSATATGGGALWLGDLLLALLAARLGRTRRRTLQEIQK